MNFVKGFKIAIIGYMKIASRERLDYLLATVKSFSFITDKQIIIGIEDITPEIYLAFNDLHLRNDVIIVNALPLSYGEVYSTFLEATNDCDFVINLMEDHFCILNDEFYLNRCLAKMKKYNASIMKATFHQIEMNSIKTVQPIYEDEDIFIYDNNLSNHTEFQKYYGSRFYIGCNFITTHEFARKFWGRSLGARPHEYEFPAYSEEWRHICAIPKKEILAAIDDPHGEDGTDLLSRNEPKFLELYQPSL